MNKLYFEHSGYGCDFEAAEYWPKGWPHDIEYPDGYMDYMDGDVWFKAYDTSLKENERDAELFEQGYLFNCEVRVRYYTSGFPVQALLYCEDPLASFPARDQEEAERLLQVAADALYRKE